jgi:hypothetical protein
MLTRVLDLSQTAESSPRFEIPKRKAVAVTELLDVSRGALVDLLLWAWFNSDDEDNSIGIAVQNFMLRTM